MRFRTWLERSSHYHSPIVEARGNVGRGLRYSFQQVLSKLLQITCFIFDSNWDYWQHLHSISLCPNFPEVNNFSLTIAPIALSMGFQVTIPALDSFLLKILGWFLFFLSKLLMVRFTNINFLGEWDYIENRCKVMIFIHLFFILLNRYRVIKIYHVPELTSSGILSRHIESKWKN